MSEWVSSARKLAVPALLFFSLRILYLARKCRKALPPGPPGLPVIGNLLDWPTSMESETFTRWKEIYGNLVYANVGGQDFLIVGDYEKAQDMLSRRGSNYSDRPQQYFVSELAGWGRSTGLLSEGQELRDQRRMIAHHIGTPATAARAEQDMQAQTHKFLCKMLDTTSRSQKLYSHIYTSVGAVILNTTYGYQPDDEEDKFVTLIEYTVKAITSAASPGSYLVDIFPIINYLPSWFPGTRFKQEAANIRQSIDSVVEDPWHFTRDNSDEDSVQRSFVGCSIANGHESTKQVHSIKWAAATMYAAGTDTVRTISHLSSKSLLFIVRRRVQWCTASA